MADQARTNGGVSAVAPAPRSRRLTLHELWPILALLAVGVALRVALMLVYYPSTLNQYDASAYVFQAASGLFSSPLQAPGYSLFLRLPHLVSHSVAFTIAIQHLLGLATAAILWWTAWWLTGNRWLGLLPAAFVVFDADALLLEHSIMSETLFRLLIVAMVAVALPAIDSPRPWRWLAAAGLLLGAAIWVRYAALILIPVLVGWALVAAWPGWRRVLLAAAAAAVAVVGLVGLQVVLRGHQTGFYGISRSGGWAIYSRVAQFADCTKFTPPPGTEALCQPNDPAVRRYPDWYGYNAHSPAIKLFGGQPAGDSLLRAWGRRALVAQPLDYASAVWSDLMLYFFPQDWTDQNGALIGPKSVAFTLRTPDSHCDPGECLQPALGIEGNSVYQWTDPKFGAFFDPFIPKLTGGIEFFEDYQAIVRTHGLIFLALVLTSLAGLLAVKGRLARAQWLLTLVPLALLVFPVATTTYNIRYGIPTIPLFALAAAVAPLSLREGAGWLGRTRAALRARLRGGAAATLEAPQGSGGEDDGDA